MTWVINQQRGHIFAGFNRLDVDHTGKVSLHNFRTCLMDIFAEHPDASHTVLLAKFCQEAFNHVSGYSSLDSIWVVSADVSTFHTFPLPCSIYWGKRWLPINVSTWSNEWHSGMFGTVFSQWRRMKIEDFGECMYRSLVQDASLEKLFRRERMRTQSLLFAAFIQVSSGCVHPLLVYDEFKGGYEPTFSTLRIKSKSIGIPILKNK